MSRRLSPFGAALACGCLLFWLTSIPAFAQTQPLATQYVDCVTNVQGMSTGSRTMLTPVFTSQRGARAYGVVVAKYSPAGACENTTTVYVAEAASTFRAAFEQGPEAIPEQTTYDGNGIEAVRWSPSGERLLIEVSQWARGTDETWNTKYLLISPGQEGAKQLPVREAIDRQFDRECLRSITSKGWMDDTRIELEVDPASYVDVEGVPDPTPPCVLEPTTFTLDVISGALRQNSQ